MRSGSSLLLVILCAGFAVAASAAQAGGKRLKEGSFRVTIQQDGSWNGFAVENRFWIWIARRKGVFAGNGILDGLTSRCISKGRTAHGRSTAEIHCENTDPDGDKIFEVSSEECACDPGGEGGTGEGRFLGGTGKYVGIRGSFRIERKVGPRDRTERTWTDYVTIVGRWTLP
ncbi:MAG: hypothetical protein ACR2O4_15545 [Hyphomicrobiaceae bacterium]